MTDVLLAELFGFMKSHAPMVTFTVAVLASAGAVFTYVVRREHHPRLQFRVHVEFVGRQDDAWVVEYLAIVKNRGNVPHIMTGLTFDVRGLRNDEPLGRGPPEVAKRIRGQLFFQDQLVPHDPTRRQESLLPADGPGINVTLYPGTSLRYAYVDRVPVSYGFILIHGVLIRRRGEALRADRVVQVPAGPDAPGKP